MNFFGIGLPEMALIFVVALLVFGPKKLPEIGRSLGKAIRSFQEASKEFETEFKREAERLEKAIDKPMQAELETPSRKILIGADEPPTSDDTSLVAKESASEETVNPT